MHGQVGADGRVHRRLDLREHGRLLGRALPQLRFPLAALDGNGHLAAAGLERIGMTAVQVPPSFCPITAASEPRITADAVITAAGGGGGGGLTFFFFCSAPPPPSAGAAAGSVSAIVSMPRSD